MKMKMSIGGMRGMTLVEVIVGISVFAIGVLSLTRVMYQTMRANVRSKHYVVATNLAHERMEQVKSSTRYDTITSANFPSENYGTVDGGNTDYVHFRRIVAIADSLNALNASVMKDVTVRVEWRDGRVLRNVEIHSTISRFKDISL